MALSTFTNTALSPSVSLGINIQKPKVHDSYSKATSMNTSKIKSRKRFYCNFLRFKAGFLWSQIVCHQPKCEVLGENPLAAVDCFKKMDL